MRPPVIVLLDVPEPYRTRFESWGVEEELVVRSSPREAMAAIDPREVALCVVGLDAEITVPLEAVRVVRKQLPACPLVVLASRLSIDSVVQLMRAGVADVIGLPLPPDDAVARASLHCRFSSDEAGDHELLGQSPAIEELQREIRSVATTHSTVLITGETGSGKGLVAREIHRFSGRVERPFVHVDCSALAPSLVESELFGHERGAFTGASERRVGRFELAADGTLFLDEIGDLDLALQRKLLRVLQDREFERIGGTRTLRMTARVLAATHRDLFQMVQRGQFRADLLYRLNVVHLRVPPLRERLADVPAIARAALDRLAERLGIPAPALGDDCYQRLASHGWPGNVRELFNLLERVLVRHRGGPIQREEIERLLEESARGGMRPAMGLLGAEDPNEPVNPGAPLSRQHIERVLLATGGNVARAARRLGIPRSTLRYRMRLYGLADLVPRD